MTANTTPGSTRARITAAGAIVAALATGATLAAPAASAAPVSTNLVLGPTQFPAGSVDYKVDPRSQLGTVGVTANAPAQCRGAADALNGALSRADAAEAQARSGYAGIISTVISPPITTRWRALADNCGTRGDRIAPPADLARYAPVVISEKENGRTASIEGFADVRGYTVDVYVEGLSATPASADRFWQVFRAQIRKVETGN